MPTFDFINIIKAACRGALSSLANPFTVITLLAGGFATTVGIYVQFFSDLQLPTIGSISFSDFAGFDADWCAFVAYCVDYSTFRDLFNFTVEFLASFISTVVSFIVSAFALYLVYKGYSLVRASLKDIAT